MTDKFTLLKSGQLSDIEEFDFRINEIKLKRYLDIDSSITSGQIALRIAIQQDDIYRIIISSNCLAKLYLANLNTKLCKHHLQTSIDLISLIDDPQEAAETYKILSVFHTISANYFKAIKALINLNKVAIKINDDFLLVRSYIGLGYVNLKINVKKTALHFYDKAFEILNDYELKDIPQTLYLDYGSALLQSKKHKKALTFLKLAEKFESKQKSLKHLGVIYNNLANCYLSLKDYENCKKYSDKLKELDDNTDTGKHTKIIQKLCLIFEAEYLINKKDFLAAITKLKKAVKIETKSKITHPYFLLIKVYNCLDNNQKAYETNLELAKILLKQENPEHLEEVFTLLFNTLKKQNDYISLCKWQEKYIRVKSDLHNNETFGFYEQFDILLKKNSSNGSNTEAMLNTERRLNTILKTRNQMIEEEKELFLKQKNLLSEKNVHLQNEIIQSKSVESALEHYQKFLKLIIDQLPVLVIVFDRYGTIVISNWKKVNTLFDKSEIVGTSIYDFFDNEECHRAYESALKGVQANINTKWRDLEIQKSISPFSDDYNVTYVIDVSVDITELVAKNSFLNQANIDLKNYASVVSHDLREPARTISRFADLLSKSIGNTLNADAKENLNYIVTASSRMSNLISDVLHYSSTGTQEEVPKVSSVNDAFIMVTNQIKLLIKETNTQIIIENEDSLPRVKAQLSLLTSLFQNIFTNAIKFQKKPSISSPSHPIIRIYSRNGIKDKINNVLIAIEDNGIGIPENKFNEIFNLFARLNSKKEYDGSGIGMATCKKIVELVGGHIWLESKLGQGTTFYIELPKA